MHLGGRGASACTCVIRAAIIAASLVLTLAGCATQQKPKYEFRQTQFRLTIIPNTTEFLTKPSPGMVIDGEAEIDNGSCTIRLREYPRCLLHEIRHCIEGDFHSHQKHNYEDCEV